MYRAFQNYLISFDPNGFPRFSVIDFFLSDVLILFLIALRKLYNLYTNIITKFVLKILI